MTLLYLAENPKESLLLLYCMGKDKKHNAESLCAFVTIVVHRARAYIELSGAVPRINDYDTPAETQKDECQLDICP
jgi:hypothetical protein